MNWWVVAAWLAGFVVYQWIVPIEIPGRKSFLQSATAALGLPFPLSARYSWLGASVLSFMATAILYLLGTQFLRPRKGAGRGN